MDWIVGIMWLAGLAVITVWFIAFVRHIFRLPSVQKSINGMSHGYLVEHGFVFDPETGRATPEEKPAASAYRAR